MIKYFTLICFIFGTILYAQVGINTSQPKGAMEVVSTESGVLLPRMTSEQIKEIDNAIEGMVLYNTSLGCLMVNLRSYDRPDGTDWRCLIMSSASLESGASQRTVTNLEVSND